MPDVDDDDDAHVCTAATRASCPPRSAAVCAAGCSGAAAACGEEAEDTAALRCGPAAPGDVVEAEAEAEVAVAAYRKQLQAARARCAARETDERAQRQQAADRRRGASAQERTRVRRAADWAEAWHAETLRGTRALAEEALREAAVERAVLLPEEEERLRLQKAWVEGATAAVQVLLGATRHEEESEGWLAAWCAAREERRDAR